MECAGAWHCVVHGRVASLCRRGVEDKEETVCWHGVHIEENLRAGLNIDSGDLLGTLVTTMY